jgi:hypothetical protein
MILHVESEAGPHGDREPRAFLMGERRVTIIRIIDRWIAADCSYFKVECDDGATCILRYDTPLRKWELTLFRSGSLPAI